MSLVSRTSRCAFVTRAELDELAGNNAHQGVVAVTSARQYNELDDVIAAKRGKYSLLVRN